MPDYFHGTLLNEEKNNKKISLPEGKGKATIVIMRCLGKRELKGAAKSDLLLKVTVGVEPVFS